MEIAIRVTGRKDNSRKGKNESGYLVFNAETTEEADQILDHI
jgi:hypothetical protein